MSVLYLLIPLAVIVAGGAVMAFIWSVRDGQFDDLDSPPRRILWDEDSRGP